MNEIWEERIVDSCLNLFFLFSAHYLYFVSCALHADSSSQAEEIELRDGKCCATIYQNEDKSVLYGKKKVAYLGLRHKVLVILSWGKYEKYFAA